MVSFYPKMGRGVPRKGIIFISELTRRQFYCCYFLIIKNMQKLSFLMQVDFVCIVYLINEHCKVQLSSRDNGTLFTISTVEHCFKEKSSGYEISISNFDRYSYISFRVFEQHSFKQMLYLS